MSIVGFTVILICAFIVGFMCGVVVQNGCEDGDVAEVILMIAFIIFPLWLSFIGLTMICCHAYL